MSWAPGMFWFQMGGICAQEWINPFLSFLTPFPPFIIIGMRQDLVCCSGWSQRVFFLSLFPSARVKGRLRY